MFVCLFVFYLRLKIKSTNDPGVIVGSTTMLVVGPITKVLH